MRAVVWIGVGLLGGFGAVARFLVDAVVSALARGEFPLGTFVVNITGAALLGACAGAALHGDALLLVGTAVLGSYTTFSTWAFESHRLGEDGQAALLFVNLALSLAVGLGAVAAGRWVA